MAVINTTVKVQSTTISHRDEGPQPKVLRSACCLPYSFLSLLFSRTSFTVGLQDISPFAIETIGGQKNIKEYHTRYQSLLHTASKETNPTRQIMKDPSNQGNEKRYQQKSNKRTKDFVLGNSTPTAEFSSSKIPACRVPVFYIHMLKFLGLIHTGPRHLPSKDVPTPWSSSGKKSGFSMYQLLRADTRRKLEFSPSG
jgi:hypothetical protein